MVLVQVVGTGPKMIMFHSRSSSDQRKREKRGEEQREKMRKERKEAGGKKGGREGGGEGGEERIALINFNS